MKRNGIELYLAEGEEELERIDQDSHELRQIGEISVVVHRKFNAKPADYSTRDRLVADYEVPVHEKALKGQAKSHGTT